MRALASPEELEPISEQWLADVRAAMAQKLPGFDEDALREYASTHALERRGEPERVTQQLLPYRLIQEVIDRPDGGMDREIVDRILDQGAACVPLLIGVLRGWTRHPENDDVFPAEAALALLGEIGDEAAANLSGLRLGGTANYEAVRQWPDRVRFLLHDPRSGGRRG